MSVNNSSFSLQNSTVSQEKVYAANSFDGKGLLVGKGKKVRRLQFGEEDRFSIAIKGKIWRGGRNSSPKPLGFTEIDYYVPLMLRDKEFVYANVRSLKRRFGISKSDIWFAFNKSDYSLHNLINNKLMHLREIIERYQTVFDSYGQSKIEMKKSDINKELLMKVMTKSVMVLSDDQIESAEITEGKNYRSFIAIKIESDGEKRIEILSKKYLARGSYGKVYEAIYLGLDEVVALKQSIVSDSWAVTDNEQIRMISSAQESIKNEFEKLNLIHSKNTSDVPLRGIQKRPRNFIEIKDRNRETISTGYLGEKYEGDLTKFYQLGTSFKLKQAEDILTGLAFLYKIDIIHGDLKVENVLGKRENEDYIADIADFGGSLDLSIMDKDWPMMISYTRNSTHRELYDMMKQAYSFCKGIKEMQNDFGITKENAFEKLKYAGKRSDLFSAGILLYKFFTKEAVLFKYDKNGFPFIKEGFSLNSSVFSDDFPLKIMILISRMLNVKDYPDLSAPEVLKDFTKYHVAYLEKLQ